MSKTKLVNALNDVVQYLSEEEIDFSIIDEETMQIDLDGPRLSDYLEVSYWNQNYEVICNEVFAVDNWETTSYYFGKDIKEVIKTIGELLRVESY